MNKLSYEGGNSTEAGWVKFRGLCGLYITMMDTVAGWVELLPLLVLLPPLEEEVEDSPESSMTAIGGD